MSWLIFAILAYFILAAVFLVDKYLLTGPIADPKVYAFYIGFLGILVLFLIPFTGFYFPPGTQIILGLSAGAVFVWGLFWFYKTLRLFEASRVVPAIGGFIPLFTFGLIYLLTSGREVLTLQGLAAFILLVLGSILISIEKGKLSNVNSLKFSALAAFFLSLAFVMTKYVYLAQPFWNGFIWRSLGGFLMAICFFLLFPQIKKEIFKKRERFPRRTAGLFLANQAAGAGAAILQNWAIFLAPLAFIPVINALSGIQYAFLFVLAVILSLKFPRLWQEEISKAAVLQKITAILLIAVGLALLAL